MKHFLLVIILFTNSILALHSQNQQNPEFSVTEPNVSKFVYTYFRNILTGDSIKIKYTNDSTFLLIDSMEIDLSLVKFIKYDKTFWANINRFRNDGKNHFIQRTMKGNINLYTDIELTIEKKYTDIMVSSGYLWGYSVPENHKYETDYYNKGFGDLKLCNYTNLLKDLSDNSQSMRLLDKSKNYHNRSVIFYVLGATSIIYGFTNAFNKSKPKTGRSNIKTFTAILPIGIGFGSFWTGKIFSNKSSDLKLEAIKIY